VIIGSDGSIKAAVIGVGGFLGVGQKDVAVPFDALNVTRTPDSNSINKITVSYTKDQLKSAPQFAYLGAGSNASTTGSGSSSSTSGSTSPMSK
jgi:PRC-barrel domain protein